MFFIINLKKIRKEKGLSQKELAKLSGISQQYIADLEKSTRIKSPTLDTIAQISIALNICVYSLINFNCIEHCKKCNECNRCNY